jgi:hypothetical protein
MAWQRAPGVFYDVIDGQAVVVDPDGTELVTLNPVGTMIWEELDGTRGPCELAADLAPRLEGVTVTELERDIAAFLAEIEAAGLVSEDERA